MLECCSKYNVIALSPRRRRRHGCRNCDSVNDRRKGHPLDRCDTASDWLAGWLGAGARVKKLLRAGLVTVNQISYLAALTLLSRW